MDVFHLFEHLKADDMTDIVKRIHAITNFEDLVAYTKETLTSFFGQYRMNENVVSVLEVIGRDYKKRAFSQGYQQGSFYQSCVFRSVNQEGNQFNLC